MNRCIFHVDINSYFASVLQQENPALRGRPVGVIKDVGRTCIIAASKEAKKLGVGTGSRVPDAKKIIPDLVLVPAQLDLMLAATRKLKVIFSEFSPVVDVFSLDEVFLDLTGCELLLKQMCSQNPGYSETQKIRQSDRLAHRSSEFPDFFEYARLIQAKITQVLGEWVTCNVGISQNKFLAKMAGEIAPKGEVMLIDESNLDEVLSRVEFADVCGIGRGLANKLHLLGVHHPYEINLLDDTTLQSYFGPHWSQELRKMGRGEEPHLFTHQRTVTHQQSVGRTITGWRLCNDEGEIERVLLNLLEEATHKLRKMDLVGRKIGVSLWGHDAYWGEYRTLKYWVRHTDEIWTLLYEGMYRRWKRTFPVIKYGVWIGDCRPLSATPQSLLPEWKKRERVYGIVDKVNDRFGAFTLHPARLLGGKIIRPEVTGYLGDKVYLGLG